MSVIILTEHHLSATYLPKEVVDSGCNTRPVAGVLKLIKKIHQHMGGIAILF